MQVHNHYCTSFDKQKQSLESDVRGFMFLFYIFKIIFGMYKFVFYAFLKFVITFYMFYFKKF